MNSNDTIQKIVFLDRDTVPPHVTLKSFGFPHNVVSHDRTRTEDVAARIEDADIVIVNKVRIAAEAIAAAPRLRLIAVAATGTDNVDLKACQARGIAVTNIRQYALHTVPEHTFALIFALRRSVLAYRDSVRAGRWQEAGQFCFFDHPIRDLAGSTLGIVGGGALGGSVAAIGRALGMHTVFAARKGGGDVAEGYAPFDEVMRTSDVITLHAPLTPATRGLIGDREFDLMQRRPILVNTARGGLVDEAALARAMRAGTLTGAGFDVTAGEPPAVDNPLMGLLDMPNFILTPHVAWASDEAIQTLVDQLVDNIDAFERGELRNEVRP